MSQVLTNNSTVGVPSILKETATVAAMTLFIALCAQISIPLPYTPVPITGTTLGVLVSGALLGSRRGVGSVALYLLLGGIGLPFFERGGHGWIHFVGATGGYLVGFLPASWLTGILARRGWDRDPFKAVVLMLAGSVPIFACGLIGLSFFVPASQLLAKGLYPFLIGDLAKSCLAAGLLPIGRRFAKTRD